MFFELWSITFTLSVPTPVMLKWFSVNQKIHSAQKNTFHTISKMLFTTLWNKIPTGKNKKTKHMKKVSRWWQKIYFKPPWTKVRKWQKCVFFHCILCQKSSENKLRLKTQKKRKRVTKGRDMTDDSAFLLSVLSCIVNNTQRNVSKL